MLQVLATVRPYSLVLGGAVLLGMVALKSPPEPAPTVVARPVPKPIVDFIALAPAEPHAEPTAPEDSNDEVTSEADVHGMQPFAGPEAFAMMFEVNGVAYVRLSTELRATSRGGRATLTKSKVGGVETLSVVAPVTTGAMPEELRSWAGASVLVDGRCRAKVVGFAEVSRVSGDPPGTEDYFWAKAEQEDNPSLRIGPKPRWTKSLVVEQNVTLAARIDTTGDCKGVWARWADETPVVTAREVKNAAAEKAALADLFGDDATQEIEKDWKLTGGEGSWRDHAHVEVRTFDQPRTGERWIFAQATTGIGGCGDPVGWKMAAYRVEKDGTVHRVTDLPFANHHIDSVFDLDGDGQFELVVSDEEGTSLVDLAGETHDEISVQYFTWGCGC
jgi:hypothetical protein